MYFLRRAHELYQFKPEKTLSPSFWESEGKNANDRNGFDAIMPGIEHPLGMSQMARRGTVFLPFARSTAIYHW